MSAQLHDRILLISDSHVVLVYCLTLYQERKKGGEHRSRISTCHKSCNLNMKKQRRQTARGGEREGGGVVEAMEAVENEEEVEKEEEEKGGK